MAGSPCIRRRGANRGYRREGDQRTTSVACRLQPASRSLGVLLGMAGLAMLHTERRHVHNTHANTTNVHKWPVARVHRGTFVRMGSWLPSTRLPARSMFSFPRRWPIFLSWKLKFLLRPVALDRFKSSARLRGSLPPAPSPIVTLHCMDSAGSNEMYVFGGGTFSQVHGRLGLSPIGLHTYCTVPPFQPRTWPVP